MSTPLKRIRQGAFLLVTVFVLAVFGYRFLGGYEWLESIWMVVITISTVGFSERSGQTPQIQLLTIGLIMMGVSASVYTCGGLIQLMLEGEVDRALGRRKMTKEISRLQDHVIICGFGRLGQDLANQLEHRRVRYVVVDIDPEIAALAAEMNALVVIGDATDEHVLESANLADAKALVTALPTDAENVFIALTARDLQPKIQIIAKSEYESSCRKLRQAGADKIVMPHRVGAKQMERMISRPSTADLVELFAEASNLDMELDEYLIGSNHGMVGKSLSELKIQDDFNLLVVGIKDQQGEFRFNPAATTKIAADDTLLLIGQFEDIVRLKGRLG